MNREGVFRLIFGLQLAALAAMTAALLARNILAIGLHVPLDPNEGWNAYHAAAVWHALYPPPQSLMINNYPPLSFPIVAALGQVSGDNIVAGRIVSLLAFLATGSGIVWLLRRMGCATTEALFGALVFAAGLLIGSDYVAMDDPQLLGHALQVAGLALLLRQKPSAVPATLLLVAGLLIKHNLLAMPLAAGLWLWGQDRNAAARLLIAALGFGIAGLVLSRLIFGFSPAALASARVYALANLESVGGHFLQWSAAGIGFAVWLAVERAHDKWVRFAALYGVVALVIGAAFSAGDGVDANIYFDAVIALSLAAGLMQNRFTPWGRTAAGLSLALPLALFLAFHFDDDNFAYTPGFRAQAARDIAFVKTGPALCEQLSLCYWAGERDPVDVFNVGEQIVTGRRSGAALIELLEARHFRAVQFESLEPFALGPQVRAALLKNYRLDHEDDNGVFFTPR
jgi:hypothetical protein